MMIPSWLQEHSLLIVAVVTAFLSGVLVTRSVTVLREAVRRFSLKRRFRRGAEGEQEALSYLQKNGFTIDAAQVEKKGVIQVDGTDCSFTLRADYLAKKKGRTCLIEVKTGKRAVDPLFGDTRRQLFEYAAWYNPDKVYLYNADTAHLSEISFPVVPLKRKPCKALFMAGVLCGAVAGIGVVWFCC